MAKRNKTEFTFLVILVFVLVYLLFYSSLKNKNDLTSIESDKRVIVETPTPRPIPHGKTPFSVGQADKTVPQFGKGSIDPYDPVRGGTLTVTVKVKHNAPVSGVSAIMKTDRTVSISHPLKLISGTNIDGEWQGAWRVGDSYLYRYALVLKAVSSNKSALVEITLR